MEQHLGQRLKTLKAQLHTQQLILYRLQQPTTIRPTHPAGAGGDRSTEEGGGSGAQVTVVGQGAQLHAPPRR